MKLYVREFAGYLETTWNRGCRSKRCEEQLDVEDSVTCRFLQMQESGLARKCMDRSPSYLENSWMQEFGLPREHVNAEHWATVDEGRDKSPG